MFIVTEQSKSLKECFIPDNIKILIYNNIGLESL